MRARALSLALLLAACGGSSSSPPFHPATYPSTSKIKHVVLIVQENKSFDAYFGSWCQAPAGSNPTCTDGAKCCEAAPAREPSGAAPVTLDDAMNGTYDPDHMYACMTGEINGGKMDRYVTGVSCADARNFALAGGAVQTYRDWAAKYAIADRYFQSVAGGSSANDMYFAGARFFFRDNEVKPEAIAANCDLADTADSYTDPMLGDLLAGAGVAWRMYAEGYGAAVAAHKLGTQCAPPPPDCPAGLPIYPCIYTPSDLPYQYFKKYADDPAYIADADRFFSDIAHGRLPAYAYVKPAGYHTEHAGLKTRITDGVAYVKRLVDAVAASPYYRENTLVLVTWDESGGYFDHVPPPVTSAVDGMPYGARVGLIAIGPFAKQGYVSHVVMEHSSIVKFLEWNFTGQTGQLRGRDATVNSIGDLLDPKKTGAAVP
jgi:phospholipase C